MDDARGRSGHGDHGLRELEDREFGRVAEVDRPGHLVRRVHQANQAGYEVVDVAEGAGLPAVAVDRDVLVPQRLDDEVRDHPAVVGMHPGAVGVEDAGDLDPQPVLSPVVEEQRFGAALSLVVAGARPDRIDVAPIGFGLRVDRRIAVDLGRRGLQDARFDPLGEAQHVDRADDAGLRGLHGIVLVMDRGGGAGEVEDAVDLDEQRQADVVPHQFETRMPHQVADVPPRARVEVVDAEHLLATRQQRFAKMRADEAGSPRYKVASPPHSTLHMPFSEGRIEALRKR